jgi:folylpolyglutamate synthase
MPLDLQLHRIQKLLLLLNNPHYKPRFIHIAGTNGKGSVCSYISHVLTESGITNGKFNSPHLITARDSIQINNKTVSSTIYERCKKLVLDTDANFDIGCTEFELLTCTAFQIFADSEIPIAIMEVGVGGRLDATNVLPSSRTIVVGVTKVALDHQNLLGNTLSEIAHQKVGIFKENVPAVIDGSNDQTVIETAEREAAKLNVPLILAHRKTDCWIKPKLLGDYQYDNLAVALKMLDQIKDSRITKEAIERGIKNTVWPGRLQEYQFNLNKIGITSSDKSEISILLDGAHNKQAAVELGKYLDSIRKTTGFVFVIAITKGKDLSTLFKPIIKSNDSVIFTEFDDNIEGMPWIESVDVSFLEKQVAIQQIPHSDLYTIPNVTEAVKTAYKISENTGKRIVVCGSLYLVADVLRI